MSTNFSDYYHYTQLEFSLIVAQLWTSELLKESTWHLTSARGVESSEHQSRDWEAASLNWKALLINLELPIMQDNSSTSYNRSNPKLHYEIIDLIDEEDADAMETEQTSLMTMCRTSPYDWKHWWSLIPTPPGAVPVTLLDRRPLSRKLSRIQTGLTKRSHLNPTPLLNFQKELFDYKKDVSLCSQRTRWQLSTTSHKVKRLHMDTPVSTTSDGTGVRLPKL